MSSHHFVKEGQEPALLVIEPIDFAVVEPLLEWSPLIIVFEHALDEVIKWGIKVDVVFADDHNVETLKERLLSQTPVKILSSKGPDTLETALSFLITTKQQSVNILVHDPAALFSRLGNFLDKISVSLLTEEVKWSAIASGSYKKWFPGGSLLLVHGDVDFNFSENLKRHDTHLEVLYEGLITLTAEVPFWIGEANKN